MVDRVVAYADGDNLGASRDFYVEVLGFGVAMKDPVLGLTSPTNPSAQVLIPPRGMESQGSCKVVKQGADLPVCWRREAAIRCRIGAVGSTDGPPHRSDLASSRVLTCR